MALKKDTDAEKAKSTPEAADKPAVIEKPADPAITDLQGAPALVVAPSEPAAPPAVAKSEEELADERRIVAESEQRTIDDAAAVEVQAGRKPLEQTMVLVENTTHTDFRQHSTGKWIYAKKQEYLLDDGWLANHVKAGLLKKVKKVKE